MSVGRGKLVSGKRQMGANWSVSQIACIVLMTASVQAAAPLSVELDSTAGVSRSEGPIPVALRISWAGPGVFDGKLLVSVVHEIEGVLARVETEELYLTEGKHRRLLLLPAFTAAQPLGALELRLLCETGGEQFPLPSLLLRPPAPDERRLVMLVASDLLRLPAELNQLIPSLKLERYLPQPGAFRLSTVARPVATREFPEEPLHYCPCDLVVLPSKELGLLNSNQLDALLGWTLAGGSLLIVLEERVDQSGLEFLEQLIAQSGRSDARLVLDTAGKLTPPDETSMLRIRAGLGRAVIVFEDQEAVVDNGDPAWRRAVAFLWKVQHAHLKSFVEEGVWDIEVAKAVANEHGLDRRWNTGQSDDATLLTMAERIYPQPISHGSGMLQRMLPEGMRLVPFGLMILLLLSYVAAIGPLDYWFLGLVRQRKLTWVLFPAVTFGFTGFAVWISNVSMSGGDHRAQTVILDVGGDGRSLKESRFELLFPSRSMTITTEMRRSLCMPLGYEGLIGNDWRYNLGNPNRQEQLRRSGPPLLIGSPPQRATLVQHVGQWTPQLNRFVSIPTPESAKGGDKTLAAQFDWSAPVDWPSPLAVQTLTRRLRRVFGPHVAAYLYHLGERRVLTGPELFFHDETQPQRAIPTSEGGWTWTDVDFLQELCVRRQPGWFGVVSQTSPGCGGALEDLALLDASDPHMWLLVVAVDEGTETTLYRKISRQEPDQ